MKGVIKARSVLDPVKEPPYDTMLTTVVKPGLAQLGFLLLDKKSTRNYANFTSKMSSRPLDLANILLYIHCQKEFAKMIMSLIL